MGASGVLMAKAMCKAVKYEDHFDDSNSAFNEVIRGRLIWSMTSILQRQGLLGLRLWAILAIEYQHKLEGCDRCLPSE